MCVCADDEDDDEASPGTSGKGGGNAMPKEIKTKDGKSIQVYNWMKRGHSTGGRQSQIIIHLVCAYRTTTVIRRLFLTLVVISC
jgi:hypothetical protein